MKKILKSNILNFLIVIILLSGLSVCAYSLNCSDILFNPKNTEWSVDNVNDALDYLYDKVDLNLTSYYSNSVTGTLTSSRKANVNVTKGKYLIIINVYNAGATTTGLKSTATLSSNNNVSFEKIESVVSGYNTTHSASSLLIVYNVECVDDTATITITSSDAGTNSIAGAGTNYIVIKK